METDAPRRTSFILSCTGDVNENLEDPDKPHPLHPVGTTDTPGHCQAAHITHKCKAGMPDPGPRCPTAEETLENGLPESFSTDLSLDPEGTKPAGTGETGANLSANGCNNTLNGETVGMDGFSANLTASTCTVRADANPVTCVAAGTGIAGTIPTVNGCIHTLHDHTVGIREGSTNLTLDGRTNANLATSAHKSTRDRNEACTRETSANLNTSTGIMRNNASLYVSGETMGIGKAGANLTASESVNTQNREAEGSGGDTSGTVGIPDGKSTDTCASLLASGDTQLINKPHGEVKRIRETSANPGGGEVLIAGFDANLNAFDGEATYASLNSAEKATFGESSASLTASTSIVGANDANLSTYAHLDSSDGTKVSIANLVAVGGTLGIEETNASLNADEKLSIDGIHASLATSEKINQEPAFGNHANSSITEEAGGTSASQVEAWHINTVAPVDRVDQVAGIFQPGKDPPMPVSASQELQSFSEMRIPNGDVNCGTVSDWAFGTAGHVDQSDFLEHATRVGNCGFLIINRRSLCDDSTNLGANQKQRAPSGGCVSLLNSRGTEASPPSEAGMVRPQALRTNPGHTVSLSCDATPLDEDNPGYFMGDEDVGGTGNTLSRRHSVPDELLEKEGVDPDVSSEQRGSKKHGIANFLSGNLFSWRSKETKVSLNTSGWSLFGKFSPKGNVTKDSGTHQQESERGPPAVRRCNLEFEPLSTTGLILEDRPSNLPAKSDEEAQRHRQEYNQMMAGAKRRELKEAQRKKKQMKERLRQEENIARALLIWNTEVLPNWESMRNTRRVRELWWQGLPPSIRGKIWSLAIGNELNITPELYGIFLSRAKEKWRSFNKTSSLSENEDCGADKESSLDLIKLDIFRTFPSLYIFQKGGPYHDLLHSVLGAYTCYRPDVGYVQGMSFIAAVLILNLEEADAFIAFANLLNKPCQMAFFRVDHDVMLKYFAAFEVFFEENLPRLFQHFQNHSLTPDFYLIDWIFTLYSKPLPLDVACRVWDLFCRDGEEALFRTALGILRLYQDVLLHMDFIHIAQFLSRLPQDTPTHSLFTCIGNTHMLSNNRRWNQVFSVLMKDGTKDGEKAASPAL
ncbi:uncharacterized protein tbc1d12a [Trichomycterus rosablanca]|uniref:uncharacterized protein tbc1d12a n=1 Tax=Trichomycterus rosablanca TaxID=2290929 RepID=UPI002F35DF25